MPTHKLSDILNKNLSQKSGLAKQIQATLICEEFDKIILNIWGEKIKNKARAIYFKNNSLTIASLSSVIAQEIKLNEKKILEKLNSKFQTNIQKINYLT